MAGSNTKKELLGWGKSLFIAVGIAVIIRTFLFSPYIVEGASMEPTLHNHEKILVNKMSYVMSLNRGDVVIIKGPAVNYVKRIIGMPGDKVEMKADQLLINGEPIKESYLSENRKAAEEMGSLLTGDFGPILVPANHYFVMGDNRLKSMDSRNGLGFIKQTAIIGESEFVVFPFSDIRNVK
ncbi:signal peptidase I [Neobacillus sp. OS1-2]|uniref:signal peptidase I n=1 Tax=Neobacillus sp. OS1-2 TaxID=3070680 RepID=UPI0027E1CA48|nr:signal peptidase I [Neobacillus sp. OS1-2]WML38273.1 signal peptidase I [Neobacillus sp. OS1-2]